MWIFWILVTLSVAKATSESTSCNYLPPGLDRLAFGVDITSLILQPLDFNEPNGYAGILFDFTCEDGSVWTNPANNKVYSKPDQIAMIASVPGGLMKSQTQTYKTVSDVTRTMAANVGIGDYRLGMFSGSATYKTMTQGISKDFREIMEVFSFVSSTEAVFVASVALYMNYNAQMSVNALPRNFTDDPEKYYKFISEFGTHYFAKGKFGGLVRQLFETSRSYYSTHSTEDMRAQAQKSFDNLVTVKGGAGDKTSQIDQNFDKNTKSEALFYGGQLNLLQEGNIIQWQTTVHDNPWVFGATLAPIYDLVRDESKKKSMMQAVQAHLDKAFLKELSGKLKHGPNTATKLAEISVLKQLDKVIPDHEKVIELSKNVQVSPPTWWKTVEICYKYKWVSTKERKFLYEGPKCAKVGEYTTPYYDNTQKLYTTPSFTDVFDKGFRILKYTNKRKLSWSISSPSAGEEWFKKVEICFKYSATGSDKQCNYGKHISELCASVNSYTEYYMDRTNDAPGGCKMSWQLRVPEKSPIWLLNTKLCFKWRYHLTHNTGECGVGSNETICAFANHWTDWYLDDTDSRGSFESGCAMQWMII